MKRLAMVGALAAIALAAGPAQASTVSLVGTYTLTYDAAPGEANDLQITRAGSSYLVTDTGATITASSGCASVTANQAACNAIVTTGFDLDLGDLGDSGTLAASVTGSFDSVLLRGRAGNDTLETSPGVGADLDGGDDEDTLTGGGDSDRLSGGDGNDTMSGRGGADSFDGSLGDDVANGGAGDDSFDAFSTPDGADTFRGGAGQDSLDMRSRDARLVIDADGAPDDGEGCPGAGCEGDDVGADLEEISSGEGPDLITGSGVPNRIFGEEGADSLRGGGGGDEIIGDEGGDVLRGGAGADLIQGDRGRDTLRGDAGDDVLSDRADEELPDVFSGGKGEDLASFRGAEAALHIDLDGRPDDGAGCPGAGCEGDNVRSDVEDLEGGIGPDVLIGSRVANDFAGGFGADRLIGGAGPDGLHGEDGGDGLTGGGGRDTIVGASGPDRIASRDGDPDQVSCGSSRDLVKADRADRLDADCDRVRKR